MKLTITFLLLLMILFSYGQKIEKTIVYFNYAKHDLTANSKTTLDNVLDKVKSKDIIQIEIFGHTDSVGSERYNKKLSQDCVERIRQYLISKGIADDKIKSQSFGEKNPIVTNGSEDGIQKNRRVEIAITYKDEINKRNFVDLTEKNETVQIPTTNSDWQTFTASPKNEIRITGRKGTFITFPKNSLVDKNGKLVETNIAIDLLEIYTKSDMIKHNIQTESNGNILETGGMVYINVTTENSMVYMKPGSYYKIQFPTNKRQKGMEVFYGDTTGNTINWQPTNRRGEWTPFVENTDIFNKYVCNVTQFGWVNCDRFISYKNKTNIFVDIADTGGISTYYLVFKDLNSVVDNNREVERIEFSNVPVGLRATIVVINKRSDQIFFASENITIEENKTVALTLNELLDKEFQHKIKQLD